MKPLALRLFLWLFTRACYRVTVPSPDNLPPAGGALLVSNPVSFVDMLLILASTRRFVRFLLPQVLCDIWWLRPFLRYLRVIPLPPEQQPREPVKKLPQLGLPNLWAPGQTNSSAWTNCRDWLPARWIYARSVRRRSSCQGIRQRAWVPQPRHEGRIGVAFPTLCWSLVQAVFTLCTSLVQALYTLCTRLVQAVGPHVGGLCKARCGQPLLTSF